MAKSFVTPAKKKAVTERKLLVLKGSLFVNIPMAFVKQHRLQAGQKVAIIINSGSIKVVPYEQD